MATGRLIDRSAFLARPRAFFMMPWRPPVSLAQDASVVALCSRVAIRTPSVQRACALTESVGRKVSVSG